MRRLVRMIVPIAMLAGMLVAAPEAAAQRAIVFGGAVSITNARIARTGIVESALTGPVLGAAGTIAVDRFSLEGTYLEGQLSPESSALGGKEVFAEASVLLRAQVGAGFSVGVGPRARAFIADAGTVRWLRFEARGRYESEVIPGRALADVELWQVLSAEVKASGGSDGGRGGSAGLTVLLPNSPFSLRLAYTADRVAFVNGASEFVDGVEVSLRIRR